MFDAPTQSTEDGTGQKHVILIITLSHVYAVDLLTFACIWMT